MTFQIDWTDHGHEPKVRPNPNFPDGIDVDVSNGAAKTCTVPLPYPAKRIGHYLVECDDCGLKIGLTTAGRSDDPRSIKLACKQ